MANVNQTPTHRYRLCGLAVGSDVPLPVRVAIEPEDRSAIDVVIDVGEVPSRLERMTQRGANWSANERQFLLDLPGIGRFLAADGQRLTICPATGTAVDDVLVFVTGTVMSAILYQRGAFLLHGSAVVWEGKAFIFCGPSGAGKSTLAGCLSRAGCTFLADDLCSIRQKEEGRPWVEPDGRTLRLYRDSIERLGLENAVGPSVRRQIDKYHVGEAAGSDGPMHVPLGAIYILGDAGATHSAGISEMPPLGAAQALLRQSYRRRLALAYSAQSNLAVRTAKLLSCTKVFDLRRPRDLARLGDTIDALIAHWAELS